MFHDMLRPHYSFGGSYRAIKGHCMAFWAYKNNRFLMVAAIYKKSIASILVHGHMIK